MEAVSLLLAVQTALLEAVRPDIEPSPTDTAATLTPGRVMTFRETAVQNIFDVPDVGAWFKDPRPAAYLGAPRYNVLYPLENRVGDLSLVYQWFYANSSHGGDGLRSEQARLRAAYAHHDAIMGRLWQQPIDLPPGTPVGNYPAAPRIEYVKPASLVIEQSSEVLVMAIDLVVLLRNYKGAALTH